MDHLEASDAESTLGDLQSTCVGSPEFLQRFRQYDDWSKTRVCTPSFTIITGDKDDPRFDKFYCKGNEVRLFIAFFLTDMPSYMGLGFEIRDVHYAPAPNEHYTKLYVFQEKVGPKATFGPYIWGRNGFLFRNITRLRLYAETIWSTIKHRPCRWLIPPDPSGANKIIIWTQDGDSPDYVFIANTDTGNAIVRFAIPYIPGLDSHTILEYDFSTADNVSDVDYTLNFNGKHYKIMSMAPGEGRVYRITAT